MLVAACGLLLALLCASALVGVPGRALAGVVRDVAQASNEAPTDAPDEIPSWATFATRLLVCDVDGDGANERVGLVGGELVLERDGLPVYRTPSEWQVSDAFVADLAGDGASEVVMLVWKQGSYGSASPFWLTDEEAQTLENEYSQHVFVFGWKDGGLKPVWMSSKVGFDIASFAWENYYLVLTGRDGANTYLQWDGWGFDYELLDGPSSMAPMIDEGGMPLAPDASAEPQTLTLLAVGDNIAHAGMCLDAYDQETGTFDFSGVYEHVASYVGRFDVAAVCQETVLVDGAQGYSGYPRFATPATMGDALVAAGFDVVLAATNHVMDQGARAVHDMLAYWAREHGATTVLGVHDDAADAEQTDCVEANGICLAVFDYTYGLNGNALPQDQPYLVDVLDDEAARAELCARIGQAEETTDAQVCFVHCGEEYASEPSAEQRALVECLVDAGADVVVCSHAHVLEPYGTLTTPVGNTGVVFFGLGNFASNQTQADRILGGAAHVTFQKEYDGADEVTTVSAYGLEPLVCHYSDEDATTVYLLSDYTDELAAAHFVSGQADAEPLSTAALYALFDEETATGAVEGLAR